MKLSWFVITSSGRCPLRQMKSAGAGAMLTYYYELQMLKPISTPSFSVFPSTSNAPEAYTQETVKSASNFVLSLEANGRNLELYSGDR